MPKNIPISENLNALILVDADGVVYRTQLITCIEKYRRETENYNIYNLSASMSAHYAQPIPHLIQFNYELINYITTLCSKHVFKTTWMRSGSKRQDFTMDVYAAQIVRTPLYFQDFEILHQAIQKKLNELAMSIHLDRGVLGDLILLEKIKEIEKINGAMYQAGMDYLCNRNNELFASEKFQSIDDDFGKKIADCSRLPDDNSKLLMLLYAIWLRTITIPGEQLHVHFIDDHDGILEDLYAFFTEDDGVNCRLLPKEIQFQLHFYNAYGAKVITSEDYAIIKGTGEAITIAPSEIYSIFLKLIDEINVKSDKSYINIIDQWSTYGAIIEKHILPLTTKVEPIVSPGKFGLYGKLECSETKIEDKSEEENSGLNWHNYCNILG